MLVSYSLHNLFLLQCLRVFKPVKSSTKVNPPGHALAIVRNSEKVPPIAGISIEQFGLLIEKIGGGRIHRALLLKENSTSTHVSRTDDSGKYSIF